MDHERRGRSGMRGRGRGGSYGGRQGRPDRMFQNTFQENPNFLANWNNKIDDFDQMNLKDELLHGVFSYGFKHPSEIQSLAIQPITEGRHVIAQAQSGTGKTGAFAIGILQNLDLTQQTTQALILAHTRELAEQIYQFFNELGARMPNLSIVILKGGVDINENKRQAANLPHVVVATPGRALDLIESGYLRCENLKMVCLDEADEMLGDLFLEQVQQIFSYLNSEIQILLFSATIPESIFNIMENFMHDPVKILVKAQQLTLEGIRQFYVDVGDSAHKFDTLQDIYGNISIQKAVIFANSKATVDELYERFTAANYPVSAIHGGLEQVQRDKIMRDFRLGHTRVLVSTDLLARGIDVQQITLVINYQIPERAEPYLHRIGRSGRFGRKGVAINICDNEEIALIKNLEHFYQTKIEELPSNIASIIQSANDQFEEPSSSVGQ